MKQVARIEINRYQVMGLEMIGQEERDVISFEGRKISISSQFEGSVEGRKVLIGIDSGQ